jgi:hypothetical protein
MHKIKIEEEIFKSEFFKAFKKSAAEVFKIDESQIENIMHDKILKEVNDLGKKLTQSKFDEKEMQSHKSLDLESFLKDKTVIEDK